jgi:uncharacterized protein YndB with AHSA1/START domain
MATCAAAPEPPSENPMSVQVQIHIDAPIEHVFDAVSDHVTFLRTEDGSTRTKVLRAGSADRNGLGCVREVRVGRRVRYVEEITAWERPSSFEYTIREVTIPLRHLGSRLTFASTSAGTDVMWTANFVVPVPVLGYPLRLWLERRLVRAFTEMLATAKGRLEGATRKAAAVRA